MNEDNIKGLYHNLKDTGNFGTEEDFIKSMMNSSNREDLFNHYKKEGYNLGNTFEDFENTLGMDNGQTLKSLIDNSNNAVKARDEDKASLDKQTEQFKSDLKNPSLAKDGIDVGTEDIELAKGVLVDNHRKDRKKYRRDKLVKGEDTNGKYFEDFSAEEITNIDREQLDYTQIQQDKLNKLKKSYERDEEGQEIFGQRDYVIDGKVDLSKLYADSTTSFNIIKGARVERLEDISLEEFINSDSIEGIPDEALLKMKKHIGAFDIADADFKTQIHSNYLEGLSSSRDEAEKQLITEVGEVAYSRFSDYLDLVDDYQSRGEEVPQEFIDFYGNSVKQVTNTEAFSRLEKISIKANESISILDKIPVENLYATAVNRLDEKLQEEYEENLASQSSALVFAKRAIEQIGTVLGEEAKGLIHTGISKFGVQSSEEKVIKRALVDNPTAKSRKSTREKGAAFEDTFTANVGGKVFDIVVDKENEQVVNVFGEDGGALNSEEANKIVDNLGGSDRVISGASEKINPAAVASQTAEGIGDLAAMIIMSRAIPSFGLSKVNSLKNTINSASKLKKAAKVTDRLKEVATTFATFGNRSIAEGIKEGGLTFNEAILYGTATTLQESLLEAINPVAAKTSRALRGTTKFPKRLSVKDFRRVMTDPKIRDKVTGLTKAALINFASEPLEEGAATFTEPIIKNLFNQVIGGSFEDTDVPKFREIKEAMLIASLSSAIPSAISTASDYQKSIGSNYRDVIGEMFNGKFKGVFEAALEAGKESGELNEEDYNQAKTVFDSINAELEVINNIEGFKGDKNSFANNRMEAALLNAKKTKQSGLSKKDEERLNKLNEEAPLLRQKIFDRAKEYKESKNKAPSARELATVRTEEQERINGEKVTSPASSSFKEKTKEDLEKEAVFGSTDTQELVRKGVIKDGEGEFEIKETSDDSVTLKKKKGKGPVTKKIKGKKAQNIKDSASRDNIAQSKEDNSTDIPKGKELQTAKKAKIGSKKAVAAAKAVAKKQPKSPSKKSPKLKEVKRAKPSDDKISLNEKAKVNNSIIDNHPDTDAANQAAKENVKIQEKANREVVKEKLRDDSGVDTAPVTKVKERFTPTKGLFEGVELEYLGSRKNSKGIPVHKFRPVKGKINEIYYFEGTDTSELKNFRFTPKFVKSKVVAEDKRETVLTKYLSDTRKAQVDNLRSILKQLGSSAKIYLITNEEAIAAGMGNVNAALNPDTNDVYIVVDAPNNASLNSSIPHEGAHIILREIFGDNPELFNQFKNDIKGLLSKELSNKLDNFAELYDDVEKSEEFLVELVGLIASNQAILSDSFFDKLKDIINKVLDSVAGIQPFKLSKGEDALRFLGKIANTLNGDINVNQLLNDSFVETSSENFDFKEGEVSAAGKMIFSKVKSKAPLLDVDDRDFSKHITQVDFKEFEGRDFVTNMYDYTTAGQVDFGNGLSIELQGGKSYVPYMLEKQGLNIGDVSNLAAFNSRSNAESFIRNVRKSNSELFAPHSGTLDNSWQFQHSIFSSMVDLITDNKIMSNQEIIDAFNSTIISEKNAKNFFKFKSSLGRNIKNFDSYKGDISVLVDTLNEGYEKSTDIKKKLITSLLANRKLKAALGINNIRDFQTLITDPLNQGVTGGEILGAVEFDNNNLIIKETSKGDIDHHPSFKFTVLAKIKGVYQPTDFYNSYDITDKYTKYNQNKADVSIKANQSLDKFAKSNVSSSAGAIPKVASFVFSKVSIDDTSVQAEQIVEGSSNFSRFTPQENVGLRLGGPLHVDASLFAASKDKRDGDIEGFNKVFEVWAKQRGYWRDILDLDLGEYIKSGAEADVYRQGDVVNKLKRPLNSDMTINDMLNSVTLHNTYFPKDRYLVKGFTENIKEGGIQIILEQDFVENSDSELEVESAEKYLQEIGFIQEENGLDFKNDEGTTVGDINSSNVIVDKEGNPRFIDPEVYLSEERDDAQSILDVDAEVLSRAVELNNGNPMTQDQNSKPSELYKSLTDIAGLSKQEAEIVKAKTFLPNFLNWFGDWIKSPKGSENVSLARHRNGEPILAVHNTNAEVITEFYTKEKMAELYGKDASVLKYDYTFFTLADGESIMGGEFDHYYFLNMRNPMNLNADTTLNPYTKEKLNLPEVDVNNITNIVKDNPLELDTYLNDNYDLNTDILFNQIEHLAVEDGVTLDSPFEQRIASILRHSHESWTMLEYNPIVAYISKNHDSFITRERDFLSPAIKGKDNIKSIDNTGVFGTGVDKLLFSKRGDEKSEESFQDRINSKNKAEAKAKVLKNLAESVNSGFNFELTPIELFNKYRKDFFSLGITLGEVKAAMNATPEAAVRNAIKEKIGYKITPTDFENIIKAVNKYLKIGGPEELFNRIGESLEGIGITRSLVESAYNSVNKRRSKKSKLTAEQIKNNKLRSRRKLTSKLKEAGFKADKVDAMLTIWDRVASTWAKRNNKQVEDWWSSRLLDVEVVGSVIDNFESQEALNEFQREMYAEILSSLPDGPLREEYKEKFKNPNLNYSPKKDLELLRKTESGRKFLKDNLSVINAAVRFNGLQGATLYLTDSADERAVMHELAHIFERDMTHSDRRAVLDWVNTLDRSKGLPEKKVWDDQVSEIFARGFELYLANGEAPNKPLKTVFNRFAGWLSELISGVVKYEGYNVKLNPEISRQFDRILSAAVRRQSRAKYKRRMNTLITRLLENGVKFNKKNAEDIADKLGKRSYIGFQKMSMKELADRAAKLDLIDPLIAVEEIERRILESDSGLSYANFDEIESAAVEYALALAEERADSMLEQIEKYRDSGFSSPETDASLEVLLQKYDDMNEIVQVISRNLSAYRSGLGRALGRGGKVLDSSSEFLKNLVNFAIGNKKKPPTDSEIKEATKRFKEIKNLRDEVEADMRDGSDHLFDLANEQAEIEARKDISDEIGTYIEEAQKLADAFGISLVDTDFLTSSRGTSSSTKVRNEQIMNTFKAAMKDSSIRDFKDFVRKIQVDFKGKITRDDVIDAFAKRNKKVVSASVKFLNEKKKLVKKEGQLIAELKSLVDNTYKYKKSNPKAVADDRVDKMKALIKQLMTLVSFDEGAIPKHQFDVAVQLMTSLNHLNDSMFDDVFGDVEVNLGKMIDTLRAYEELRLQDEQDRKVASIEEKIKDIEDKIKSLKNGTAKSVDFYPQLPPKKVTPELIKKMEELKNKERALESWKQKNFGNNLMRNLKDITGVPRLLVLSLDASFVLYQGFILGGNMLMNGQFRAMSKAFGLMFKNSISKKGFIEMEQSMANDPLYAIAKAHGLNINLSSDLNVAEELQFGDYLDRVAGGIDKKLGDKRVARTVLDFTKGASERAYNSYLNTLRLARFKQFYENTHTHDPDVLRDFAETINTMSGASQELGSYSQFADSQFGKSLFIAPRLYGSIVKSMIHMSLIPDLVKANNARKNGNTALSKYHQAKMGQQALNLAFFTAFHAATILMSGSVGEDEEDDSPLEDLYEHIDNPFEKDFLTIKRQGGVNAVTISPFVSYVKLMGKLIGGEELNSREVDTIDHLFRFVKYKLTPTNAAALQMLSNRDFTGYSKLSEDNKSWEKISKTLPNLMTPILVKNIKESVEKNGVEPQLAADIVMSFFGVNYYNPK